MAYGKSGGCTPITSRIQKSTQLGMKVQDPLLNLGSPNKMNEALVAGEGAMRTAADNVKKEAEEKREAKAAQSKKSSASTTTSPSTTEGPSTTEDSSTAEAPDSPAPFNAGLRKAKAEGKLPQAFAAVVKKRRY